MIKGNIHSNRLNIEIIFIKILYALLNARLIFSSANI